MCDREGCWLSDDECTADYFDEKMQLTEDDYLKDPRVISDEAVEAAALALFERDYGVSDWAITNEQVKAAYMDEAKTALEAAAPRMLAEVLEDAADTAQADELTTAAEVIYDLRRHADALRPVPPTSTHRSQG